MIPELTREECRLILQQDLMSFIERSFLELDPEARLLIKSPSRGHRRKADSL